ncbi:MAG: hypothetical protein KDD02_11700, partial [Phaeodactylibacter sp.]|nr:hypothetical protein [Phaeodactylibacter sp.]
MNKSILLICLSLALSFRAAAQFDYCFGFEDFTLETQFGPATGVSPGDVIFSAEDVKVSLQEIQYLNGTTGFLNAMIYGPPQVDWLDGQFIFLGNNSLLFDFSAYPNGVSEVCFDFFDGGGEENFAVNGSAVSVVQLFSEIGQLSIPGVSIQLTGADPSNVLQQGTVCITGDIQSLLIGGQEFGVDNVCFRTAPPPPCPIENLQAEIVSCDNEGNFNIEIDFDWTSPLTVIAHFDIFVDGEPVAYISQTDLPYLLEGVQPLTDALEFNLSVCQNDHPDCCASVVLQKQCPEGSCVEFEGLEESVYGSSTGTPPGVAFYNESNVGLLLIPFQSLFWTTTYGDLVVLNTADDPAMMAASGQYLKFESINAVFDLTAYPDPIDSVIVDFYYNGGAINIAANGASILIQNSLAAGLYALAPTVTLQVVFNPGSATEGQLIFRGDVQSLLIGGGGDFRIDNFCINPIQEPCELSNLDISPLPCTSVDPDNFFAAVDFDYQGVSDSFEIISDGGAGGHFAYSDLPVTIGPIPLNNIGVYAFFVKDLGMGGCTLSDTIQAVACTGCAFQGLTIDYQGVTDAGQTLIELDFTINNPSLASFFTVYFNGEPYEQYGWDAVPVQIAVPCIPNTTDQIPQITVCEGQDHCCVTLPLLYAQPCPANCEIYDMEVQAGPCNPNGVFNVKLNFEHQNVSDTFQLWLNGNATGQYYAYDDLPITLSPFVAPTQALEFKVVDGDNPDCMASVVLPPQNCNPCPLEGLEILAGPQCNLAGGFYYLKLRVLGAEQGDTLSIRSTVTGAIINEVYHDGFVELEFPANGPFLEHLLVCLLSNNTAASPCCEDISFDVACPPCWIQNVDYHLTPCTDAGNFSIVIDHISPPASNVSAIFYAFVNGEPYGPFSAVNLPVTIGAFPADPNLVYEVVLTNSNTGNCAYTFTVGPVNCNGPCSLESVQLADTPSCTPGSDHYVVPFFVDGAHEGDVLTVQSQITGAVVTGVYEGLLLVELPTTDVGFDRVLICDSQSPNCCVEIDYDIYCPPCAITDFVVEPHPCNNDGAFLIDVDFNVAGNYSDTFYLSLSTGVTFTFSAQDLPVTLGPVSGAAGSGQIFVWLNDGNQGCGANATFQAPDCNNNGDCLFTNVIAEPHACNADGQFLVDIAVQVNNPGAMGYLIFADGEIHGPYSYNEPFVALGPFAGDGVTVYDFLILDLENPTCYGYVEVGPIDCSQNCEVFNLTVQTLDCNPDGTYGLVIDFDVANPGNAFFDVYGGPNNTFLGYYPIAELPVTISNFPASGNDFDRIKVCINDHPDCCRVKEFAAPDCSGTGDCNIYDATVSLAYCDSTGFYVQLHFQYDNVGNDGYKVQGNGQVYGTYSYNEPFPVLGPFPPELDIVWELVVRDVNHPDCSDFVAFTSMYCDDMSDSCIGFDPFDALQDTVFLADFGDINDSIYFEDGVLIWTRPITWNNNPDYFGGAIVYPYPNCGFSPDGAYLYVSGALEFDFSAYAVPPNAVSFDLGYCSPNAIPTILLTVNDETYEGSIFDLPDALGGVEVQWVSTSASGSQLMISLNGVVNAFTVGSISVSIDNICFEGAELEVVDNCLEFAIFDDPAIDTLADYGHPEQMDYTEAGVHVTAQAIEWNGVNNYFTGVYATDGYPCGFGDVDAALQFGGALRFDFSGLGDLPNRISFDLAFCAGQDQYLRLKVNGESYAGSIYNLPATLPNGIGLAAMPSDDGEDWHIVVEGHVEALTAGGILTIDNLCYELGQQMEEVWPGDANHDNIAHHVDLLNVGLAFGAQGPARATDSDSWMSFLSSDWDSAFT